MTVRNQLEKSQDVSYEAHRAGHDGTAAGAGIVAVWRSVAQWGRNHWACTAGQDMAEYALLAGIIILAIVALLPLLGASFANAFTLFTNQLGGP